MSSPNYASADSILNADDLGYDEVEVPGWGLVRVQGLTGSARIKYDRALATYKAGGAGKDVSVEVRPELTKIVVVELTVVDGDGKLVFNTPEKREKLRQKSAKNIQLVYDCSARLSGLMSLDDDNSEGTPGEPEASP